MRDALWEVMIAAVTYLVPVGLVLGATIAICRCSGVR